MSKIIFTGTGSGFPSINRACLSFLLQFGERLYQFDAGEGFTRSALRYKINCKDISKIFISHLHPDHISGLLLELQWMYLENRARALDIYVPDEALEGLNKAADLFYLFKEKFPFKYRFKPIKLNPVYRGKDISVYAFRNKHLIGNERLIRKYRKRNKMQSYSYIIKLPRKRILYSGDLCTEDDIAGLLKNVHTVIAEGMHTNIAKLAALCKKYIVRRLILNHLPDDVFGKRRQLLEIARASGFKNLVIARDGLSLRL